MKPKGEEASIAWQQGSDEQQPLKVYDDAQWTPKSAGRQLYAYE